MYAGSWLFAVNVRGFVAFTAAPAAPNASNSFRAR
jgi:hypothetical protein